MVSQEICGLLLLLVVVGWRRCSQNSLTLPQALKEREREAETVNWPCFNVTADISTACRVQHVAQWPTVLFAYPGSWITMPWAPLSGKGTVWSCRMVCLSNGQKLILCGFFFCLRSHLWFAVWPWKQQLPLHIGPSFTTAVSIRFTQISVTHFSTSAVKWGLLG